MTELVGASIVGETRDTNTVIAARYVDTLGVNVTFVQTKNTFVDVWKRHKIVENFNAFELLPRIIYHENTMLGKQFFDVLLK